MRYNWLFLSLSPSLPVPLFGLQLLNHKFTHIDTDIHVYLICIYRPWKERGCWWVVLLFTLSLSRPFSFLSLDFWADMMIFSSVFFILWASFVYRHNFFRERWGHVFLDLRIVWEVNREFQEWRIGREGELWREVILIMYLIDRCLWIVPSTIPLSMVFSHFIHICVYFSYSLIQLCISVCMNSWFVASLVVGWRVLMD